MFFSKLKVKNIALVWQYLYVYELYSHNYLNICTSVRDFLRLGRLSFAIRYRYSLFSIKILIQTLLV